MNNFERTLAFVPDHFIRHYTVDYYFLLINAKNTKTVPYIGKHIRRMAENGFAPPP